MWFLGVPQAFLQPSPVGLYSSHSCLSLVHSTIVLQLDPTESPCAESDQFVSVFSLAPISLLPLTQTSVFSSSSEESHQRPHIWPLLPGLFLGCSFECVCLSSEILDPRVPTCSESAAQCRALCHMVQSCCSAYTHAVTSVRHALPFFPLPSLGITSVPKPPLSPFH